MSNNNNQQRRTILSGASLVVGAVGLLAGLAAVEHVQAQDENRESMVQGVGRWVREIFDQPSSSQGPGPQHYAVSRRLSPSEIDLLPVRHIQNTPNNINNNDEEEHQEENDVQERTAVVERDEKAFCVVCREHYENGDSLMRLPCFHEFHTECIRGYLETSEAPVCPICRHPVTVQFSS